MATDPNFGRGKVRDIGPNILTDYRTGTASGTDFVYAWTTVDGYYEIRNNTTFTTSSAMSQPTSLPVWNQPTETILTVQGTVGINVVNIASGTDASAYAGHWNHTTSNAQGGLDLTGSIVTLSGAEKLIPVTQTATVGTYKLPNGVLIEAPGTFSTGYQNFSVMPGAGPWPTAIAGNTSGTVAAALLPVWAQLGQTLNLQGAGGMESFTDNWSPAPN